MSHPMFDLVVKQGITSDIKFDINNDTSSYKPYASSPARLERNAKILRMERVFLKADTYSFMSLDKILDAIARITLMRCLEGHHVNCCYRFYSC